MGGILGRRWVEEGVAQLVLGLWWGGSVSVPQGSVLLHPRAGRGHWGQPCPSFRAPVPQTKPGVISRAVGLDTLVLSPPVPGSPHRQEHGSPAWQEREALPRCVARAGEPALVQGSGYQRLHEAGERPAHGLLQDPGHRPPLPGGKRGQDAAQPLVGGTAGGHSRPIPSFPPAFQAAKRGCRHFVCSSGNRPPSGGSGSSGGCSCGVRGVRGLSPA